MKTTATNRKVREILTSLRDGRLVPRPEFQRRLVWSNKDKSSFLETVLLNYPFPEVYVAAGEVDVETGEGTELLVDGQQRLTTLFQYFYATPDLVLTGAIEPYATLSRDRKEAFLQYDVVVRDMGRVEMDIIRNVFQRINATRYALNAMEIHNSRYEGEFKRFAEEFAQRAFFEQHRVFSAAEIRRMQDARFVLVLATTALSTYFNRDDDIEEYLKRYNDDFPHRAETERELDRVLSFVEEMSLPVVSRAWKKADLFTLLVELHRRLCRDSATISAQETSRSLEEFYAMVDDPNGRAKPEGAPARYYKAALQATNDRSSRMTRGEIIRGLLGSLAG